MTTKRHDLLPSPGFSDDDSAPASNLSSMQRAIVTIQKLRAKVESLERTRTEPIAIVGMGCRFPGGANNPEAFFRLLEAGIDAVTEVPPERWPLERESADSEGEQRSLRWGAFLKDVDRFDAAFFGISRREAESLDPQQRLLLEVTWEALERAGQLPERLMGSKTGVFIGIWSLDYQHRVISQDQDKLDAYCFTGNVLSTAAGRLAYTLGLQGPCMSVETACSSSLTAIHLACQSLRAGESSMALAGGVNLMLSPTTTKLLSKTQALSPDGRCKTFDARANGFVRGEGCGILVLKRLSDAERDGDAILAVIRGSAVNQDGRSTGLTAPNVLSQQALLRQALENARLAPQDIGYVETHGTGTSLGDPIEMEAIKAVLGAPREKGSTCILGAVKTNIGHLEAAAGVAGVIKVVLAMQNDKIPGNLHFRSLNPRIDLMDTSLEIANEAKPWAPGVRPRCAGVSSFGISGTNAHVIIEEAPRNLEEALTEEDLSACLLPLSAKNPAALRDLALAFHEMFTAPQSPRLLDIVHTASARRTHYLHRLSVVGRTKEELATQLRAYLDGNAPAGVTESRSSPARAKVVFVFSGQGAQWIGMGRQLYDSDSSFRSVIDTCDNLMTARLGWSILDELDATESTSRIGETQVAQPLLFAVQIALVEMLRSWGIAPDAMIGHSVGEIAAAHIAGILSLDEAIRLVSLRGRIMQKATGMGKMVSVSITHAQAQSIIEGYEDRISIAAINDPNSVVLAGAPSAIDDVIVRCEKQGFTSRPLRVNYAFHSPQMDPFERELVDRLVRVDTRRATLAMYSTVLAECVDGKELDVRYWGRNIRETVDFAGAMSAAIRDGYQLFLEVGPHPVLTANIQHCFPPEKSDFAVAYTMRRNAEQRRTLLEAIGALYTRGCAPEWSRVVPSGGKTVALPTYPWRKEVHWIQMNSPSNIASYSKLSGAPWHTHPLLGMHFESSISSDEHTWQQALSIEAFPYLVGHRVVGDVVFPGTGFLEMSLAATAAVAGSGVIVLDEIVLERLLVLIPQEEREFQTVLQRTEDGTLGIAISSRGRGESTWTRHVTVRSHVQEAHAFDYEPLQSIENRCTTTIESDTHYASMDARGLTYTAAFRGVQCVTIGDGEVLGWVTLPESFHDATQAYTVHPALLDACLQAAIWALGSKAGTGALVPRALLGVRYFAPPGNVVRIHSRFLGTSDDGTIALNLVSYDESGKVWLEIEELRVALLDKKSVGTKDPLDELLLTLSWSQKAHLGLPAKIRDEGAWLIVRDSHGLGHAVGQQLRALGQVVIEASNHSTYGQASIDKYFLDLTDANQLRKLFNDAFGQQRVCRGIIHCSSLDTASWGETSTATLGRDLQLVGVSALRLTQAAVTQGWRDIPKLVFVTRGTYALEPTDTELSPVQASLWGLGRTIALEHPTLECIRLDLPALASSTDAKFVVQELFSNDGEDQVACRNSGRFVARLVRTQIDKAPEREFVIHNDKTYLITGGLGGLGLELANWLVAQGARHLILIGRSSPTAAADIALQNMRRANVHVRDLQVDVANYDSLASAFALQMHDFPPLAGVVHAAGILDDHTILQLSSDSYMRVMGAKAFGAVHLHQLTAKLNLDFFILYSSAASVIGSPGQGNYAAANAFLDGCARARVAQQLPAMSIAWGPFTDVGMAAEQENRGKRLASRGMESITPAIGHELLFKLMRRPRPEIGALRLSVQQWQEFFPQAASSPVFADLRQETTAAVKDGAKVRPFRQQLEAADSNTRPQLVLQHTLEQLGRVLRLDPKQIDPTATFASMGIDSLMSLELRNHLQSSLGIELPPTLLFTYPTTDKLVVHILSKLNLGLTPSSETNKSATSPAPTQPADVENMANLEVDDLMAILDEELAATKKGG